MSNRTVIGLPSKLLSGGKPTIVHIMNMEKFISPFIDFMEENFADFDRHIFYCFGSETLYPIRRRPNVLFASDNSRMRWAYIELIRRHIVLKGDIDDEQRDRIAYIARRCPIHRTLEASPKIEDEIDLVH